MKEIRCIWEYDEHHWKYDTECNNGYWLDDGTLDGTNIKYCPFCGEKIREIV